MGLIVCEKCKALYSEHLYACPKCGCPRDEQEVLEDASVDNAKKEYGITQKRLKTKKITIFIIILLCVGVIIELLVWYNNRTYEGVHEIVSEPIQSEEAVDENPKNLDEIIYRKTYDLIFFNVHGPVKKIIVKKNTR